MDKENLISQAYCKMNADIYNYSDRSAGGAKHAAIVKKIAPKWETKTILDYGCGQGEFKRTFKILNQYNDALGNGIKISEYDPAIIDKDVMPLPADLIVCTDVLEHVEPDKIDAVLKHIFSLMLKAGYFVIALCPTKVILPDDRNAHILLKPIEWWIEKITSYSCEINHCSIRIKKNQIKDIVIWLTKL